MWNRYRTVEDFGGKPWLLRFFDQIRFYPVSAGELQTIRRDFPLGRYPLRIEHTTLKLAEYQQFLADEAPEIEAFRAHQQAAFNAERERWIAGGQAHFDSSDETTDDGDDAPLRSGESGVESPVAGNLWQVNVEVGNTVREGDVLVVLESMKMEIPLVATQDGVVSQVRVQPGSSVRAGQCVVVLEKTA
jgi:urea carboxylase